MNMITVDFTKRLGAIKPLHGVNNGPISFGGMLDNRHHYRELGVPWARLHDTNWPHPREVDIPQIFPNFEADPEDPASYFFGPTDDYLRSILDTGAKIIFRLGVSIEHYQRRRYVFAPADFKHWARICLGIVRHYTEGWADGIPNAVEYWEIWNEPDLGIKMWSEPYDQYMELYRVASTTLKNYNPALKVGGPAAAIFDQPSYPAFLDFCEKNQLPLDFYSWHLYAPTPGAFVKLASDIRQRLDAHGFQKTPMFLTEWNFLPSPWEILCGQDEYLRREGFDRLKNEEGAAFCASLLIRMQDAPVEIMNYYDGQAMSWFCGLFDYYGVPQKTFYAFKAFREMLDYPERVSATCDLPGVDVLAAGSADGKSGALLISNFGAHEGKVTIRLEGLPDTAVEERSIHLLDRDHNLTLLTATGLGVNAFVSGQNHLKKDQALNAGEAKSVEAQLRRHSACLIKWGASPLRK